MTSANGRPSAVSRRTFRAQDRPPWAAIALLLVGILLMAVPGAAAQFPVEVSGEVQYDKCQLDGHVNWSSGTVALMQLEPIRGNSTGFELQLQAENLVVNWSRITRVGIGSAPGNPSAPAVSVDRNQAESGEKAFQTATITVTITHGEALVLAASPSSRFHINGTIIGSAVVNGTAGGSWEIGEFTDSSGLGAPPDFVHRSIEPPHGENEAWLQGSGHLRMGGAITWLLWHSNLTVVDGAGNTHSFRSGTWSENETGHGPSGRVSAEFISQLLTIRTASSEGLARLAPGSVRWVSPQMNTDTVGVARFLGLDGTLQTPTAEYEMASLDLEVSGHVIVNMQDDLTADGRVRADVSGRADYLNVRPSQTFPDPNPFSMMGDPGAAIIIAAAVLPVAGVGAVLLVRHRKQRFDPDQVLNLAEVALAAQEPRRARNLVKSLLDVEPMNVDAWFIHGASLLQESRITQVIDEVEPVAKQTKDKGLAFVVGYAHARNDDLPKAGQWLSTAATDPLLRQRILAEPLLREALEPSEGSSQDLDQTGYG